MDPYPETEIIKTMPAFWSHEGSDLLTNALRRIYATNDRLLALQVGLQEIVQLTGAERGVLLVNSHDGGDAFPLFMYGGAMSEPYKFAASDVLLNRWVISMSETEVVSLPVRIPLKDFGTVVGAIHIDKVNYSGALADQKRTTVEVLLPQLALIVAFVVENSELLRVAKERQTLLEMLSTTGQISQRLNANTDVEQILTEFVEACHFLLDAKQCSILEVDWETETLKFLGGDAFDLSENDLPKIDFQDSITISVARSGEPALIADVSRDPRYNEAVDGISGFELHQLMCVPLSIQGRVLGIVQAINKVSGDFDELDLNLLQLLATNVAIALENARFTSEQQAEAEQKAELYSVASHGLRSPLMSILTSVDWILETGVQNESHQTRLEDIRAQTFSLASFAGEILDMSRIEMGHMRIQLMPVAIIVFVKKILATFERRAPNHRFELEVTGQIPPVRADETQLAIVMDHLLENAIKYSPEDSLVRVEISTSGEQVMVAVCDEGQGIAQDEHENIFTRFYRGRDQQSSKGHSLGLGLYITQKLIQAQGGDICVESTLGQGTTFRFTLLQEEIKN